MAARRLRFSSPTTLEPRHPQARGRESVLSSNPLHYGERGGRKKVFYCLFLHWRFIRDLAQFASKTNEKPFSLAVGVGQTFSSKTNEAFVTPKKTTQWLTKLPAICTLSSSPIES
jgi:hypothetical protein